MADTPTALSTADSNELERLCRRYASAADDKDFDAMGSLFALEGELITERGTTVGRETITKAFGGLARYDATFHLLGQMEFWLDPPAAGTTADGATEVSGQVYCIAHHFTAGNDRVMYIRYHDRYVRSPSGEWQFRQRRLVVPATIDEPR